MGKNSKGNGVSKGASKKKIWSTKQVLASPFAPQMPSPIPGTGEAVLDVLKRCFSTPPLRREPRESKSKVSEGSKKSIVEKGVKKPAGLVMGVNQVTKGLERETLALVVLVRDVMPSVLVSHIPPLCFTQSAKLVVVPGDGTNLGEAFGIRRMLAFAITRSAAERKKDFPIASDILQSLCAYAVHLDYPWLAAAKGKGPVPFSPEPKLQAHTSLVKKEKSEREERKEAMEGT